MNIPKPLEKEELDETQEKQNVSLIRPLNISVFFTINKQKIFKGVIIGCSAVGLLILMLLVSIKLSSNSSKIAKFEALFHHQFIEQSNDLENPISPNFNLWNMDPKTKKAFLHKYSFFSASQQIKISGKDDQISILSDKDAETKQFFKQYEKQCEIHDWFSFYISESEKKDYQNEFKKMLSKRNEKNSNLHHLYWNYKGQSRFEIARKGIQKTQMVETVENHMLTGQDYDSDEKLKHIYMKQKKNFEDKYGTHQFQNELHACVVVPTYNNEAENRSIWHLQSILQQQYQNYRMIIVDDASKDRTIETITRHLKWRNVPKEKVILVKSKIHRTAMENIYYATHRYCDFNQIFYLVDGDDELIGTQVFKIQNAIYQNQKLYTLYSNNAYFNFPQNFFKIGQSEDYPQVIINQKEFRHFRHSYHHLRTMISDLFLLTSAQSLQDSQGKFYWTIYDNALYFPALEMSCGKSKYIPELLYWYNVNTGHNDYDILQDEKYREVQNDISSQKKYVCIDQSFRQFAEAIK